MDSYFNSRPSARGDGKEFRCWLRKPFQFTPLREGRLRVHEPVEQHRPISIHAPPRGATRLAEDFGIRVDISIHAPPRGATFCITKSSYSQNYFNSRPSARGDAHADALPVVQVYFNSRPSARGDRVNQKGGCLPVYFNSRPSARGDIGQNAEERRGTISIHAPPRGATRLQTARRGADTFQFTPLREGRRGALRLRMQPNDFNSRPSARGDRECAVLRGERAEFQFTPLREGRLAAATGYIGQGISIHAPPRGATQSAKSSSSRAAYFNSRPSARGDGL